MAEKPAPDPTTAPEPTTTPRNITRRSFIKSAASVAVGATLFPSIVPASALGLGGTVAPSNRIVMASIGLGSQGTGNMKGFLRNNRVQIVALCDVDQGNWENGATVVNETYGNKDCVGYKDFRELLERSDLDAVSIALPDHWHSIPAIAAAKKGLDMYAEKPLALTIPEGRAMCDAVDRYGVVWQTGSWQRSNDNFRHGCEMVRNGRLGAIHTVKVGLPTGKPSAAFPEMPVPNGFDYDFWLGPAPEAPYTQKRCHWNFRWILDYSGGQLTDWAAHHCDIANWGMGTESTGPKAVRGKGDFPKEGLWNAATQYYVELVYAPGASPVAPKGFQIQIRNSTKATNDWPMGVRFEGEDGWLHVSRNNTYTSSIEGLQDSKLGPNERPLYRSNGGHSQNFLDCVRTRKATIAPIQAAHHAINLAHLGNISMQLEREIKWDPEAERFVNDPEADRKLTRAMRQGWHV